MAPSDLVERIDGIVHEETQVGPRGVDLTVAEVHEVADPGRVDFGGGELESAELVPHERVWRNEDDDYQWWHLREGTYLVEYNESLDGDRPVDLQTRSELLARGAYHPTLSVTDFDPVPLTVPRGGIRIKENARVSTVLTDR